jgi:ComF family protein
MSDGLFPREDLGGGASAAARPIAGAGWARRARCVGTAAWQATLDLLFPPWCLLCETPADAALCDGCIARMQRLEDPRIRLPAAPLVAGAVAAGSYAEPLREALLKLKYGRHVSLAEPLAGLLAPVVAAQQEAWKVEALVAVPIHPARERRRGFNQAGLLAEEMGRRLGLPVWRSGLLRVRETPAQAGLDRDARLRNIRDAFHLPASEEARGRRLLLIDDIATTGATLGECARVLTAAGAVCYAATVAVEQ